MQSNINNISFNFSQARRLITRITSSRKQFKAALEELDREVADMHTWWEGNSYTRFREIYSSAASGMPSRLETMDETSDYVTKVSNGKDDFESRGKSRF